MVATGEISGWREAADEVEAFFLDEWEDALLRFLGTLSALCCLAVLGGAARGRFRPASAAVGLPLSISICSDSWGTDLSVGKNRTSERAPPQVDEKRRICRRQSQVSTVVAVVR
jgi:hypothetical protein